MSDTIGSALITIEPDFSKFERELTIGLQKAIEKVQKSAEVTLKLDTQGSVKAVEKDFAGTNNVLQEFNQSQAEIVKGISKTNKSLNQLSTTLTGTKASAQSTLAIIGQLFNILGNIGNVAIAIAGIKNLTQEFLKQRQTIPGVIGQFKLFFKVFSEFAVQTSKTQSDFKRDTQVFSNTTNSLDQLNQKLRGAGASQRDFAKKQSFATAQLATQAKTTEVAALATTKFGVETSKTAKILERFKSESGGINIGLATGANVFNTIRNAAVSATGAVSSYLTKLKAEAFPQAPVRNPFTFVPALAKKAGESVADYTRRINEAATATGVFSKKGVGFVGNLDLALRSLAERMGKIGGGAGGFDTAQAGFKGLKKIVEVVTRNFDDFVAATARVASTVGGGGPLGFAGFISELSTLASVMTATFAIVAAGSAALIGLAQKASTANESINAVSVTLGDSGKKFQELIGNTTDLGLSSTRLNQAITPIVPLLKNAGLEADELAVALNDAVRAGVDLSSIFNVEVDQSLGAIAAGIRGEIEPLERLGVAFNAAEVEQKALSLGFQKTKGQLEESAKQYARLQLILDKASFAQGDFKNTADSLANAQRILKAKMSSTVGVISAAFLPAAQRLIQTFIKLSDENGPKIIEFFSAATPLITKFADLVADLADIASKAGGILQAQLLPILKALIVALTVIAPLVQALLVGFLSLGAIKGILAIITASLAAFVPSALGAAAAVSALSSAVSRLVLPIGLAVLALQLFGVDISKSSELLLGGLGKALKFIIPLLTVLILRGLATVSIAPAIALVNLSITRLAVSLVGITPLITTFATAFHIKATAAVTALSGSLTKLVRGPIPLIIAGLFILGNRSRDLAKDFKNLQTAAGESFDGIARSFEKSVKVGLAEGALTFIKGNPFKALDDVISEKTQKNVRDQISGLFDIDPKETAFFVKGLESAGSKFAEAARKQLTKLQKEVNDRAKAAKKSGKTTIGTEKTYFEALKDTLSALESIDNAFQGVQNAQAALTSARLRESEISKEINELEKERLKILSDTLSEEEEITTAKDALLSIELQLKDLTQERINLEKELQELTTPATVDELAEAHDKVLSAQIAINDAKRVQIELEEELSPLQKASIDLSGLTLDQARSRLRAIRASLSAQKAADKPAAAKKAVKTQEEIDDERITKEINVRDAQRGLTEAIAEEDKLKNKVLLNSEEIEKTTRSIVSNEIDVRNALREQDKATTHIQRLLGGETTLKLALEAIDKQITQLAENRKDATEAIRNAEKDITKAKEAQALAIAEITQNEGTITKSIQDRVDKLKEFPDLKDRFPDFDKALEALNKAAELEKKEDIEAEKVAKQKKIDEGIINQANRSRKALDFIFKQFLGKPGEEGALLNKQKRIRTEETRRDVEEFLLDLLAGTVNAEGNIRGTDTAKEIFANRDINVVLADTSGGSLRDIINKIIEKLNKELGGQDIQKLRDGGFVPGVPGSFGRLARLGEFGLSELVLPITDTQRSSALLAKYAPEISLEGARKAGAIASLASVTTGPVVTGPLSNGSKVESRKPSSMENKMDRLIQLQEERNHQAPGVNAPITITEAPDRRYTARQLAREIKRRLDNI